MYASARASTILIVDSHTAVLHLMAEVLERSGYKVLAAGSAAEALDLLRAHGPEIRLAVVDVYLPRVNGPALADRLAALQPGLRVLFVSEYEHGSVVDTQVRARGLPLLTKPFSINALTQAVEKLLGDRWAATQSVRY